MPTMIEIGEMLTRHVLTYLNNPDMILQHAGAYLNN